MGTVLLIVLILMLIGAFPTWPHSKNWGYYSSSGLGLVVVILLVLVFNGQNLSKTGLPTAIAVVLTNCLPGEATKMIREINLC